MNRSILQSHAGPSPRACRNDGAGPTRLQTRDVIHAGRAGLTEISSLKKKRHGGIGGLNAEVPARIRARVATFAEVARNATKVVLQSFIIAVKPILP